jgi:hypothetical protein
MGSTPQEPLVDNILPYQTKTNKRFWYCQACHDRQKPAMHSLVMGKLTGDDVCFKCGAPFLVHTQATPAFQYVYEEFDFKANPPPFLEQCSICSLTIGKYWPVNDGDQDLKWFYCPNKTCGNSFSTMTAFCQQCLMNAKLEELCPVCNTDLSTPIEQAFYYAVLGWTL